MNVIQPWNLVYLVGFVTYTGIRHTFQKRVKGEKTAASRIDGLEKALLIPVFVTCLVLPAVYLFTPLLAFADYSLPAPMPWIGSAIMVMALGLFWRSHADLGRHWSVSLEIREGHQLIAEGVYRRVRHPMYASIWLWNIAQGMLLQNWLAGWAALVGFGVLYFARTPREERMMCETFGEEYRAYMRRTGRMIPKVR